MTEPNFEANIELGAEDMEGQVEPIHVIMDGPLIAQRRVAPQFGACTTWALTVNIPVQLLQRRPTRYKAKTEVFFPTNGGTVIFAPRSELLANNQGYTVTVTAAGIYEFHDWESEQPLWIITPTAGVTVSILDESYEM